MGFDQYLALFQTRGGLRRQCFPCRARIKPGRKDWVIVDHVTGDSGTPISIHSAVPVREVMWTIDSINNKETDQMHSTEIQTTSRLTCPRCGFQQTETMPTDACLFYYECAGCKTLLRPLAGDCCVFCSYGTVACPPMQEANFCGGGQFSCGK